MMGRLVAVSMLVIGFFVRLYGQNPTNKGTEFWTAYMDHNSGASFNDGLDSASVMSLYITSDLNTTGNITIADGSFKPISFTVTANQVTIVTIPPYAFLGTLSSAKKGIHIVTAKPVAIYAHIYAYAVSAASLLLPVNTLGNNYTSINYEQRVSLEVRQPAYSAFVVVATEDNTLVNINPAATLIDGHANGVPFSVALNKGEVYQGLSANDLTGSKITSVNTATGSCSKVAFFSGSSRLEIGCNPKYQTSDNLFQQGYPIASWGKNFISVPLKGRNYDIMRIVLSNPATTVDPNVKVNGVGIPLSMFNGSYYEFQSQQANIISADQPIEVAQYSITQDNTINCGAYGADLGDPEMVFLNPIEQTTNNVTLYSTGNFKILLSFINVIIPSNAVASFKIDGYAYTGFIPVAGNPAYSYAQIQVQPGPQDVQSTTGTTGTHYLSAGSDFNAIAYGFGKVESYGYSAGTSLQNLNENIVLSNPANYKLTQPNGCAGVSYDLELNLPYQTTRIVWDLKNGITYTDNSPKPVATTVSGTQLLYHYLYPKPVTYSKPGDTAVIATVINPVAGECGSTEVVEFDFNISEPPVVDFSIDASCLGDSTRFNDKTNANGNYIKTWLWNFGDHTTSTLQNPAHLYTAPGIYKVTLTVANADSCSSSNVHTVVINHKPIAAFNYSSPDCTGQNTIFTDKSTSLDEEITKWIWNYGDGKTDTLNNDAPVSHIYTTAGTDTVKLTVLTNSGCQSDPEVQTVSVNPMPVVNFILPAICLSDTFARFTDSTSATVDAQSSFTYLWNFGDPNANVANPNASAEQNPVHKYTAASNYNVTLTVTSKNGCVVSKTKPFTVNGDIPAAAFSIENVANLCSSDNVIFDDLSTVNFGSLTKMKWYFDYTGAPDDTLVFSKESLPANRKYSHNYGVFNSPSAKTYTVRLDAYSGITCISTAYKSFTLKSNPLVSIAAIGPLCQASQPVQIVANNNGYTGMGVFTGVGVSSSGLFDPAISGTGNFNISYTFSAQNGCDYTTSEQVVVSTAPVITTGPDVSILPGGEITLPAKSTGDSLTFKWIPSAGLDHDDILNPIASPAATTIYQLTATNTRGCTAVSTVTVNVLKGPVVPNAFTPNGDGVNDTWDIKYLDTYPNCTVQIFNRYGETVYSSNGYPVPWDGRYKGAELPTATYYYIINPKNGQRLIAGDVTIIR